MKRTLLLFFCISIFSTYVTKAQSPGDFRSVGTGDWYTLAIWETYNGATWVPAGAFPTSTNGVITIQGPNVVTVTLPVTVDQVVVATGGTLVLSSLGGFTFAINDGAGVDLTVNGTLQLDGGVLSGLGTTIINNACNLAGTTIDGPVIIASGATLTLNGSSTLDEVLTIQTGGTFNWTAGTIFFSDGTLSNSGTITVSNSAAASLNNFSGTNVFNNNAGGIFTKSSGGGTLDAGIPVNNAGTFNVNNASYTQNTNTFTNAGVINIGAGATFNNSASLIFNGGTSLTGSGTLTLAGTTHTINLALSVPSGITTNLSAGTLLGTGSLTATGTVNWSGTTIDLPTTIASGATLTLNGSSTLDEVLTIQSGGIFNWTAGTIFFSDGTLSNSGTITVSNSAAAVLNNFSGSNVFNNNASGVFTKSSGGGTLDAGIPVNNAGTFNVNNASYTQTANTFTNAGVVNIGAGSTLNNSADLIFNGGTSVTGSGTLTLAGTNHTINLALSVPSGITTNLSAGTLLGTGSLTANGTVNWSGTTIDIPVTIASGATLVLNNTSILDNILTIQSGATFNWTAGTFNFSDGTLNNSGTINVNNAAAVSMDNYFNINNIFNNNASGIFNKTGGAGVLTVAVPFTNAGTIGGTGVIDITGTLTNTGIVAPGLSPGILTLNSLNPLFIGSGSLNIEMQSGAGPGTGHDQLQRAGNLVLGGMTLNATQPGVVPLGNYTIINLTSGTITGAFSTVNLPPGYIIAYNLTTVVLTKTTLPVVLVSFTGMKQGNSVMLNWRTASEQISARFEIQRSKDGILFESIGQVKAIGNSNIMKEYSFSDLSPFSRINYYRLKQIDLDGNAHLSPVVRINFDRSIIVRMLPNPAFQFIRFDGAERFTHFDVIDLNGKRIKSIVLSPSQKEYPIHYLSSGIYSIQLMNGKEMQQFKLIKL